MTQALRDDHDALRDIMRDFAALMADGSDNARQILLSRRLAFSRIFHRHRRAEGDVVQRILAADPITAKLAQRHAREVQRLCTDYSAHVNRWTPERVTTSWTLYCAEVLALQARLRDLLAWEEREVHPRLHQAGARAA